MDLAFKLEAENLTGPFLQSTTLKVVPFTVNIMFVIVDGV